VREVSALIDYSLAIIDDSVIDLPDLHPKVLDRQPKTATGLKLNSSSKHFYDRVAHFEAEILRAAYSECDGNISQLALSLGMDRSHLHTKLKLHGIHTPKSR
jgi:two-component system nitrogen regulation response regulator NtrX